MIMDYNGVFSFIMGKRRKKSSMKFGSLFKSFGINHWFYKESTKFTNLDSIHCVQWFNWDGKHSLLDLLMKYEKW